MILVTAAQISTVGEYCTVENGCVENAHTLIKQRDVVTSLPPDNLLYHAQIVVDTFLTFKLQLHCTDTAFHCLDKRID
jgi:hypothetical protein